LYIGTVLKGTGSVKIIGQESNDDNTEIRNRMRVVFNANFTVIKVAKVMRKHILNGIVLIISWLGLAFESPQIIMLCFTVSVVLFIVFYSYI
jgi:hypothetical protein